MAKDTTTDNNKEIEQLFAMGAHLGHRKSRVHPKANQFIYSYQNGVSIIDLTKTTKQLEKARKMLTEAGKDGKKLLVVVTKKNNAAMAAELSEQYKIPYATTKWLPGLLTNFDTIFKNVKKLTDMRSHQQTGEWEQFVKHERVQMSKKMYKLERLYKGLVNITKKPDIIVIVDAKKEKNAVKEAMMYNMPIVGIIDTNCNPDDIDVPVMLNDDSPEVVKYALESILKAYSEAYIEKKEEPKLEVEEVKVEEKNHRSNRRASK